mmetsp:Transcript_30068/g.70164  ORF Transcript_30068/g.70164 Transcript_30068/m.70164 type:complete len:262 (-) Transcript_30068:98-883(-)
MMLLWLWLLWMILLLWLGLGLTQHRVGNVVQFHGAKGECHMFFFVHFVGPCRGRVQALGGCWLLLLLLLRKKCQLKGIDKTLIKHARQWHGFFFLFFVFVFIIVIFAKNARFRSGGRCDAIVAARSSRVLTSDRVGGGRRQQALVEVARGKAQGVAHLIASGLVVDFHPFSVHHFEEARTVFGLHKGDNFLGNDHFFLLAGSLAVRDLGLFNFVLEQTIALLLGVGLVFAAHDIVHGWLAYLSMAFAASVAGFVEHGETML